jgi:hypothetical protein
MPREGDGPASDLTSVPCSTWLLGFVLNGPLFTWPAVVNSLLLASAVVAGYRTARATSISNVLTKSTRDLQTETLT